MLPEASENNKMHPSTEPPKLSSLAALQNELVNICSLKHETEIADEMGASSKEKKKFTVQQVLIAGSGIKANVSGSPMKSLSTNEDSSSVAPVMSGALGILKRPTDENGNSVSVMAGNLKWTVPANSSGPFMAKWNDQGPQNISDTMLCNVVSPVINDKKSSLASQDFTNSEASSKCYFRPAPPILESSLGIRCPVMITEPDTNSVLSAAYGAEEFEVGQNKSKGKRADIIEATTYADGTVLLPISSLEKTLPVKRESRDVLGQGSIPSSIMSAVNPTMEETGSLPSTKPPQRMRHGSDNDKCNSGRSPPKRVRNSKASVRPHHHLSGNPLGKRGELDDDYEELLTAAGSIHSARKQSCYGLFWKKMEPYFASITHEDMLLLKQKYPAEKLSQSQSQVFSQEHDALQHPSEKLNQTQSQVLKGHEHDGLGLIMQNYGSMEQSPLDQESVRSAGCFGGLGVLNTYDVVPTLFQRALSALIDEDEDKDLYTQDKGKNVFPQCTSDNSCRGSSNRIDWPEVESSVDLSSRKYLLMDRFSHNKSASSSTNSNPRMSSFFCNNEHWKSNDGVSLDSKFSNGNHLGLMRSSQVSMPSVSSFNCQNPMSSVDNKLLLELQSIGICPEMMPHLEDRENSIDREIKELQERLYQQAAEVKKKIEKIEKNIQREQDLEQRNLEEAAMDRLVEIAYKRITAVKARKSVRKAGRKITKQEALAFVERTLARCRQFEETGRSCFSQPNLQDVMLREPLCDKNVKLVQGNGSMIGSSKSSAAPKKEKPRGSAIASASGAIGRVHSHCNIPESGFSGQQQAFVHSSELASQNDFTLKNGKKKPLCTDPSVGTASSKAAEVSKTGTGGLLPTFCDAEHAISHTSDLFPRHDLTLNKGKRKVLDETASRASSKSAKIMSRQGEVEQAISCSISGPQEVACSAQPSALKSTSPMVNAKNISNCVQEFPYLASISQNLSREVAQSDTVQQQSVHPTKADVRNNFVGLENLSSFLNFEDDELDFDYVGLAVPMDDLSEVQNLI